MPTDMHIKSSQRPRHCPTCDSPATHLHPAIQHEGEVQPCRDQWHRANSHDLTQRIGTLERTLHASHV